MARRAIPDDPSVILLLTRGLDVNRDLVAARAAADDWLVECDQHHPRPTNRQIGEAIGLTEGEIRRRLRQIYNTDG